MRILKIRTSVFLFFTFLLLSSQLVIAAPQLSYRLAMPEPQTHYYEVEIGLKDFKEKYVDLKMPVWAPGSYLVREFAKNVEGFSATAGSGNLRTEKISKNTWRVYTNKSKDIKVKYKVYAFELTVRTSFLDEMHGYLNGTSVFMYPDKFKQLPSTITIQPDKSFAVISTALPMVGTDPWVRRSANYDELADSPMEIGNHKVLKFEAAGVPHEIAMFGESNFDDAKIVADMKKITEEATSVFGEHPVKGKYVFIIHNILNGGGGLEHLNSTTLQVGRWGYAPESSYNNFLGLVAHEYFHLWNVKRLRPKALGPFNYDGENYTSMLWVSEGFTSYYDDLIVRRAGFTTPERYLDVLTGSINNVENTPGNKVQSVSESSFDAWIKFYRPNENSKNAEISYYTKGGVLGALLDLEIMHRTNGEKSLEDAMRYMYRKFYKDKNEGFTDAEFKEGLEKTAGLKLDDFYRDHIYGTVSPEYSKYFGYAGLKVNNLNASNAEGVLGANTLVQGGKVMVTAVTRGGSAWKGGLNVNDEIISLNGYRVTDDLNKSMAGRQEGEQLKLIVNRDGQLMAVDLTLGKNQSVRYKFEKVADPTPLQQKIFKKWLRIQS